MQTEQLDLITTRPGRPGDYPLIFSTWLKGLYYGDTWFSLIPKDIFMANYHAFLERLLGAPGVDITVACLKEDEDVILGYSVYCNTVLHWTFCKKAWRGIGVARSVTPQNLTAVTHLTSVGRNILPKLPGVIFNPFAL